MPSDRCRPTRTGIAGRLDLRFPRRLNMDAQAIAEAPAAVLSRTHENGPRPFPQARNQIHSRTLGSQPLGTGGADAHVYRRTGTYRGPANVAGDPWKERCGGSLNRALRVPLVMNRSLSSLSGSKGAF